MTAISEHNKFIFRAIDPAAVAEGQKQMKRIFHEYVILKLASLKNPWNYLCGIFYAVISRSHVLTPHSEPLLVIECMSEIPLQ